MRMCARIIVACAAVGAAGAVARAAPRSKNYAKLELQVEPEDRPETVCIITTNTPQCAACSTADKQFSPIDSAVTNPNKLQRWRINGTPEAPITECSDENVCKPELSLPAVDLEKKYIICSRSDGTRGPGRVLYVTINRDGAALKGVALQGTLVTLDFLAAVTNPLEVNIAGGDYVPKAGTTLTDADSDGAQSARLTIARRCSLRTALLPPRDDGWQGKAKVELVDSSNGKLLSCETSVAGRSFDIQIPARPDGQLKSMTVTPIVVPALVYHDALHTPAAGVNQSWSLGAEWTSSLPPAPLELGWTQVGFAWHRSCHLLSWAECPTVLSAQRAQCQLAPKVYDHDVCHYTCDAKPGTLLRFPMEMTFQASVPTNPSIQWKTSIDAAFDTNTDDLPENERVLLLKIPDVRTFRTIWVWLRNRHYEVPREHQAFWKWGHPQMENEDGGYVPVRAEWGCNDSVEYSYSGRVLDVGQYSEIVGGMVELKDAQGMMQVDLGVEHLSMSHAFSSSSIDPTASASEYAPRLLLLLGNIHTEHSRTFPQAQFGVPIIRYQPSTSGASPITYVGAYAMGGVAWEHDLGFFWFRPFAQLGPQFVRRTGTTDTDAQLLVEAGLAIDLDVDYLRHIHFGFGYRVTFGQDLYDRVGTDVVHDRTFPIGAMAELSWEP